MSQSPEMFRQNKPDLFDPVCGVAMTTAITAAMVYTGSYILAPAAAFFATATVDRFQDYFRCSKKRQPQ